MRRQCGRKTNEGGRRAKKRGIFLIFGLGLLIGFSVLLSRDVTNDVAAQSTFPSMTVPNLGVRATATDLITPISMAFLAANDFLVLEKNTGKVKRIVNGGVTGTVLDLGVNFASERGLLALHSTQVFPPILVFTCSGTCRSTALPADPFFPDEQQCLDANMFAADTEEILQVPLNGNRVDRFVWTGSSLTFDHNLIMLRAFQNDGAPVPPGQGDEAQPPRGIMMGVCCDLGQTASSTFCLAIKDGEGNYKIFPVDQLPIVQGLPNRTINSEDQNRTMPTCRV